MKIWTLLEKYDFFVPQKSPEGYENSFYTLGVLYLGEDVHGVSWKKFREELKEVSKEDMFVRVDA